MNGCYSLAQEIPFMLPQYLLSIKSVVPILHILYLKESFLNILKTEDHDPTNSISSSTIILNSDPAAYSPFHKIHILPNAVQV
jgi:hypothetical protein